MTSIITERSVGHMNMFLRGEMAAVQTYSQCIERLGGSEIKEKLRECLRSHQRRVDLLKGWVLAQGGTPSEHAGLWGVYARLVEGGAKILGENAALAALEEGERQGQALYRRDLGELDYEARRMLELQILPEEQRSRDLLAEAIRS